MLCWHYREQQISPFQAALCNSVMMKLEGEGESERRRKGSILHIAVCLVPLACITAAIPQQCNQPITFTRL